MIQRLEVALINYTRIAPILRLIVNYANKHENNEKFGQN